MVTFEVTVLAGAPSSPNRYRSPRLRRPVRNQISFVISGLCPPVDGRHCIPSSVSFLPVPRPALPKGYTPRNPALGLD